MLGEARQQLAAAETRLEAERAGQAAQRQQASDREAVRLASF